MTSPQLYPYRAPNAQAFVIAWLMPLGPTASRKDPSDTTYPFRMVTRIGGITDRYTDTPMVSVHTFAQSAGGTDADTLASRAAQDTHDRMLVLLDDPTTVVTMLDGSLANCNYLDCTEAPMKVDYRDTAVIRYVARYEIGFSLVSTT